MELCGGGVAGDWGLGLRSERRGFELGFMNCDVMEVNLSNLIVVTKRLRFTEFLFIFLLFKNIQSILIF